MRNLSYYLFEEVEASNSWMRENHEKTSSVCQDIQSSDIRNAMWPIFILASVLGSTYSMSTEHHTLWQKFKAEHNKVYGSPEEEEFRFGTFRDRVKIIEEHNSLYDAGLTTYTKGINQFSDMTEGERLEYFETPMEMPEFSDLETNKLEYGAEDIRTAPDAHDWRTWNKVTSVKDQGACGSCYVFAAIGSLESAIAIKSNRKFDLSEQEILDCTYEHQKYPNYRCKGGTLANVFQYLIKAGVSFEEDYPYYGANMSCRYDRLKPKVMINTGFRVRKEDSIKNAVYFDGPIAVSIDFKGMVDYKRGVFIPTEPFEKLTHSLLVVGYGTENGIDYWILKNSYGPKWGESGYMRLQRNPSLSVGIERAASYPFY